MLRALVLGGGGPVGVAWEAGLLAGLAREGVDVSDADLIVGTSAGSIVGSQLALGKSPAEILRRQVEPRPPGRRASMPGELAPLMGLITEIYTSDRPLQEIRAKIGAFAASAEVISEDEWVAGFSAVELGGSASWPERPFVCTAIDVEDGSLVEWRNDSGVPLGLAVASSCAVPGMAPPVTIGGRRYMDGGIGSTTNSHIAARYDKVLVVALAGGARRSAHPLAEAARQRFTSEIESLRATGSQVEVLQPGDEFVRTVGANLMDVSLRVPAAELGEREGEAEAEGVRAFWPG